VTGERTLMRIHIGERDKHDGKPLYEAIVHLLRTRGFAGATVFRGIMGFGASAGIHTEKVLRLSLDLPIVVETVETEEKIQAGAIDMSLRLAAAATRNPDAPKP
jgi:uncharacterized protein